MLQRSEHIQANKVAPQAIQAKHKVRRSNISDLASRALLC
jgi:hypothetical protein